MNAGGIVALLLALAPPPDDATQDLVILGETRPILLRVRATIGDRPFRAAWSDSVRTLHAQLDRDGDGRVSVEEAEAIATPAVATAPAATPKNRPEVDVSPKDGAISVEELEAALRASSGPFRIQVEGDAERRTDALFDHLDLDKDGGLGRSELEAIAGSLRRLDRDADELIDLGEINLLNAPVVVQNRATREPTVPPVVLELGAEESPVRLVRVLMKKYDTGSSRGPGKRDSRLSNEEFAIPAAAFAACDGDGDGLLNAEEVRSYLARSPRDAILEIAFSPDASGRASARVRGEDGGMPAGITVRQPAEGVIEVEAGLIRLDIHVNDGDGAAEAARKGMKARFDAADANQDGYLEADELGPDMMTGLASPLAGLFQALDRDGDKKIYPREVDDYVARQALAARGRLSLTASNEGRALFGMLDLDRDRRLGAREVQDAFARVTACDRDRDGRVAPEEIPHHIQLILARGDLSNLAAGPLGGATPAASRARSGPSWFRKMDRNRDGDVSRREFLGSREQFDRLDLDHDGLLSPDEAESVARSAAVKAPGG